MISILKYQFMQNALMAGLVVGVLCSVLSVFVVLRRMAFIGQGIAHAAFGGIALALLFNLDLYITTTVFCVIIAVLIGITSRKGKLSEDSSIGLFLTTSMALGVILLKLRKEYTTDLMGYLFGNILAVSRTDVIRLFVLGIIVLGFVIYYYRQLQFFTFDEEMAQVSNIPVKFLYYALLVILAVVIVLSVQIVGIILVSAFLIIPATVALLIGRHFLQVMLISIVVGVTSTLSGLTFSYYAGMPSGAIIVVTMFVIFSIVWLIRRFVWKKE
ncbi:MAG: metal ABC transporter permease [Candidatus Eremiobacteraeota bacterium]|nr:metal ABC transporter permease [Candidatus Eremiobacteraeota bacterium]